jgi:hypothetical protein
MFTRWRYLRRRARENRGRKRHGHRGVERWRGENGTDWQSIAQAGLTCRSSSQNRNGLDADRQTEGPQCIPASARLCPLYGRHGSILDRNLGCLLAGVCWRADVQYLLLPSSRTICISAVIITGLAGWLALEPCRRTDLCLRQGNWGGGWCVVYQTYELRYVD